jgi:hypothetical protein
MITPEQRKQLVSMKLKLSHDDFEEIAYILYAAYNKKPNNLRLKELSQVFRHSAFEIRQRFDEKETAHGTG